MEDSGGQRWIEERERRAVAGVRGYSAMGTPLWWRAKEREGEPRGHARLWDRREGAAAIRGRLQTAVLVLRLWRRAARVGFDQGNEKETAKKKERKEKERKKRKKERKRKKRKKKKKKKNIFFLKF